MKHDWKDAEIIEQQKAMVETLHKTILKAAKSAYEEYNRESHVHDAGFDSLMAHIQEAIGECVYSKIDLFDDCDWYGTNITEGDLK